MANNNSPTINLAPYQTPTGQTVVGSNSGGLVTSTGQNLGSNGLPSLPTTPYFGNPSSAPAIPSTIPGGSLGNSPSLSTPNYAPNAPSTPFVASLPIPPQAQESTDTSGTTTTDNGGGTTDPFKKQFSDFYGGLVSKLGLEGPEYQNLQQQYQIPQIAQNLAQIRGTIAQRTAGYTAQWQLANTEHAALPYIAGEQTQIQRTQAVELGMLTAQEQALSGNLQAANDIVDRTIQHEFDPIKNMLTASSQWFQMHQNDLTASEQKQYELNNSLVTMTAQNLFATKSDAAKLAIQYGASPSVTSAIANAKSTTDIYNALSGLTSGGAGLGSVVNGYDLSTYATDPNYSSKIQNASSSIGTISNTQQANQLIQSTAPNSPVNGEMIANAAKAYNVDPNMLASIMKVESNYGTLGVGARTNNPGNVGNTDSGATVKYKSWQDGVNAVAQQLQNRKVSVQDAISTNTNQSTQKAVISTAPLLVQPGIRFTSGGTAFIDKSRIPGEAAQMAGVYSARSGIPILDDSDVKAVQGLDTAMQNLKSMTSNFNALAPSWGLFGKLGFKASAPISKLFDTDYGAALSAYQSNRDNLFQQIAALAGSHPKINSQELTSAANALPKLNELNTDTLKDGDAKVKIVQNYLDNSMKAIMPTYNPVKAVENEPPAMIGNSQYQKNTDGTYTRLK